MKVLRTDRGGEFLSNQFTTYCRNTGLDRHYTSPYSPQQNGVVERRNRSVLEMVRSCLKTMNVPNVLWGEAVNHAVYVLNRVSTKALKDSTPYEMWTGRNPHVGHLRVFGCTAHMKIAKNHLKKLEDRSKRVVYLGTEKGSKAYRLLDPDTGSMYVSRDVEFEEDQTWNWEKTTKIKAIPGMSFTVEGLDLDEFQEEEIDSNWTGEEQPINSPLSSQGSPQSTPINQTGTPNSPTSPATPNSRITPNSPIPSNNSPSTASSSTGGGAPKRYRLLSDLYESTEQLLMIQDAEEPNTYQEAKDKSDWVNA